MSAIDGHTLVHGIIGNPVGHSLSPAMHNAAFAALGMNQSMSPFRSRTCLRRFLGFGACPLPV